MASLIWDQKHNNKKLRKLTVRWGGINAYGQFDRKIFVFYDAYYQETTLIALTILSNPRTLTNLTILTDQKSYKDEKCSKI